MEEKVGFALIALKTEQFATFQENLTETHSFELNIGLEFKINQEQKQIGVFSTFNFRQGEKTLLKIQISCHFGIESESWEKFITDSKIVFPKGFISHLVMLTIGTARGVLHAKTENSVFNRYLLPTIDVTQLVNKDVEFPLV